MKSVSRSLSRCQEDALCVYCWYGTPPLSSSMTFGWETTKSFRQLRVFLCLIYKTTKSTLYGDEWNGMWKKSKGQRLKHTHTHVMNTGDRRWGLKKVCVREYVRVSVHVWVRGYVVMRVKKCACVCMCVCEREHPCSWKDTKLQQAACPSRKPQMTNNRTHRGFISGKELMTGPSQLIHTSHNQNVTAARYSST